MASYTMQMGVCCHPMWEDNATYKKQFPLFAEAGFKWVRCDLSWAGIEPKPGAYDLGYLSGVDVVLGCAEKYGLSVVFMVLTTPAWAGPTTLSAPSSPAGYVAYGAMMAYLAKRYAGRPVVWEPWTEPDEPQTFTGTIPEYVELVKVAYPNIKTADPSVTVLGCSVANEDWGVTHDAAAMFSAGIDGYFDVFSVHAYHLVTAPFYQGNAATLLASYGRTGTPVWITEFGWSTKNVSFAQQADLTLAFLESVSKAVPKPSCCMVYKGADTGNTQDTGFGILDADLAPKPVYGVLKAWIAGQGLP